MSKWSEPNNLPNIPDGLVGSKHTFPDNDSIMIFEIKLRDRLIEGEGVEGITPFITYEIQQGPGLPRRHVMPYNEFLRTYGHLFPAMSGIQE